MPDRYDDYPSRRPVSGADAPRAAAPRGAAEEDPLVELARLVSGSDNFDDMVAGRASARAVAAPPQRQAPAQRQAAPARAPTQDDSFDLESELMNDLQSSFDPPRTVARSEPARAPAYGQAPQRAAAPPAAAAYRQPVQQPAAQPRSFSVPRQTAQQEPVDPYAGTAYAGQGGYDRYDDAGRSAGYDPVDDQRYEDERGAYAAYEDDRNSYDENYDYEDDGEAYEDEPPPRSRKGLIIAVVVLGVILAGGLAAMALRGGGTSLGSDGAPRVIAADEGPTKVKPAEQPTSPDDSQQNKLIYDRANPDSGNGDQLVMPNNAPVAAPADQQSQGSREISRIILPGAPGDGSSADPGLSTPSPATSDAGPRKVRTVIVKPDGTIISSQASTGADGGTTAGSGAPGSVPAPVNAADASAPQPPPSDVTPPPQNPPTPPVLSDTNADTPAQQPAPAAVAKDNSQQLAPKPPVRPRPAVTAQADTAAPTLAAGASGGYVVQVSSQRTQDQALAAYKSMQRKYPAVLGGHEPNIAKADLGAKGTYYRARIGPWGTRDEAVNFCESLRTAGGSCIVQKNGG